MEYAFPQRFRGESLKNSKTGKSTFAGGSRERSRGRSRGRSREHFQSNFSIIDIPQSRKGFVANCARNFPREFRKIFVAQVLSDTLFGLSFGIMMIWGHC